MPADSTYHRRRRLDPAVRQQRRTYKAAYARALARLRDEYRGRFCRLLHEELVEVRADAPLAAAGAGLDDSWRED